MVVGGHSGPRPSEASRTLYLKAGQQSVGSDKGYGSLSEAQKALSSLTAGPKQGAALIVEHGGRFYGQQVFGLETNGNQIDYHLEKYASQGKVDAGILNSAVKMIVDGSSILRAG